MASASLFVLSLKRENPADVTAGPSKKYLSFYCEVSPCSLGN